MADTPRMQRSPGIASNQAAIFDSQLIVRNLHETGRNGSRPRIVVSVGERTAVTRSSNPNMRAFSGKLGQEAVHPFCF